MLKLFLLGFSFSMAHACAIETTPKTSVNSFGCKWSIPKYLEMQNQTEEIIEYFGFDNNSKLKKIYLERNTQSDYTNKDLSDNYNLIFEYKVGDFKKYKLSILDASHNPLVLDSSIVIYKKDNTAISFTGFSSEESDGFINNCH
jgi:hypothetical protein